MENNIQHHLSDEQFSDLLAGIDSPAIREHLAGCTRCAEEADRVSSAIGSFQQQSRLWAERRAASHPLLTTPRQPAFPWLHRPQAWTAAAVALALAVGIGISVHNTHPRVVQQQAANVRPAPSAAVSPTTLKADNELLSAIDGELRADESAPATTYGLTVSSRSVRTRASRKATNE